MMPELSASVFNVSTLISRSSCVNPKSFRVFGGDEPSGGGVVIEATLVFLKFLSFCGTCSVLFALFLAILMHRMGFKTGLLGVQSTCLNVRGLE